MLDFKVFAYRYVFSKELNAKDFEKFKSLEKKIKNKDAKKKFHTNIGNIIKIMSSKNMSIPKQRYKVIDEIFEFKSLPDKVDTDEEKAVYKKIEEYFKTKPTITFNLRALYKVLSFIRIIRRNKELEKQIYKFRENTSVTNFIKEIKKSYPQHQYLQLYTQNKNSILNKYQYFFEDYISIKMPKDVEKLFAEIFNTYNMVSGLKLILIDLFFCGIIPLEKIITKFIYRECPLPPTIPGETIESGLDKIFNYDVLNFLNNSNNLEVNKKEYPCLTQFQIDVFDYESKYFFNAPDEEHKLTHIQIGAKIKNRYPERKIKLETPQKYFKEIERKINSIFQKKF